MKMQTYKKRRARYAKACYLDAKRGQYAESRGWKAALTLYIDAHRWFCRNRRQGNVRP